MKPQLIRLGNRILNLANVRYMDVEGPNLVNVYLIQEEMIQFAEHEAHALLAILETGYVTHVLTEAEASAKSAAHS